MDKCAFAESFRIDSCREYKLAKEITVVMALEIRFEV